MSYNWDNQYCLLSEQQRADPLGNLLEVVGHRSLFDQRKELYHWMVRVMTCELSTHEMAAERDDQFWFFQMNLRTIETIFRIHEMIKSNQLIYSYKQEKPQP